ncbi:uncharacterized protein ACMZJ9_009415 [Mantella aurantiaca]
MASADLRDELDCSICLDIYTDPVNLRCGHNFCRICIDHVLDTQDGSGGYSCPECRQRFRSRPKLQRNITLRNIVEAFRSTQLDEGETGIFCSYCIRFSMPAIKSCLMCEASLCEKHLKVHSKSPEHVLTEPTTSMEKRKCSVHQKILEYYCTMEATCICVSCSLTGEHQGHKVETLDEASGKKKKKLRDDLQRLVTEREVIQKKVQGLHEHRRNIQQRVTGEKERVTTLLRHLRRQLEDLEKRVLREISRQEEQQLHPLSDMIQQLETKKDDLSRKMGDIEELCNMTDPMTVLQESHTGDLCDTEDGDNEDRERQDKLLHDGGGLDVSWIPHTLHTGLSNMMKEVNVFFNIQETTDILLDINTAHRYLHISDDMKSVSWSNIKQNRPEKPERFENCSQVLSRQTFSSGRYYWEVDVSQSERWIVGMCYPSTERTGWFHSWIGHNNKSWGLYRHDSQCSVIHDSTVILSIGNIPHKRVRIYLDYEAGGLSLYELCDPIRHLHTFTTTFTEPLHVALWVGKGCIKIPGGSGDFHFSLLMSAMASADLRQELDCSICLTIYTDPVNLRCGHNFCRVCIDRVLDTQDGSGGYSCPECREEFQDRPTLQRNITLRNIVETFRSTKPDQETGIFCTYCIHSPVPAVISCLLCEASLCNDHLKVHSKSPEHVLTEPTTSMKKRKCSVHKKILEYYCTADAACICVSCRLDGKHQGHKVETLDEASERKKQKLRTVLQKMMNMREETEKRVQNLRKCKGKVQEDSDAITERVTALFIQLRRQLEDLEKRVLREISRQEERLLHLLSDLIQQLEIKKDHLSRKMGDIEELCNMTDPMTVLQESHTGDLCDTEEGDNEDRERHDKLLHDGGGLDVAGISHTLHTGLSDMMKGVNVFFNIQEAADILLDVNTAHNNLQISDDRKTVSWSDIKQNRPETPERFQDCIQVLSSRRFSSGRHYWEVDVRGSDWWFVGMSYPSIERRGKQSHIGMNKMSWCVYRYNSQNSMGHNKKKIRLPDNISSNRVRIFLDYEAGKLSFYDLCDPIRHLHTFTTTFTEPLHAALCIYNGHIKICGQDQEM